MANTSVHSLLDTRSSSWESPCITPRYAVMRAPMRNRHHNTMAWKIQTTVLHHTTPHHTTPHHNTLHYTTPHHTTPHHTTLHYTTLHYTTLHYTTLHHTTLHHTTLLHLKHTRTSSADEVKQFEKICAGLALNVAKDGDWDDGSVGEGQGWVGHYSVHINMPPRHANPSTPQYILHA